MNLAFLRKMLEVESLPPPPAEAGGTGRRRSLLRLLVAPETLPLDAERPARVGGGWLRMLLAPEVLPPAPPAEAPVPASGRRRGAGLLAREELPLDPPAPPRQRRAPWLAWLFRPEKLSPAAPPPPRQRSTRWLRWLFGRERIDADQN